MNGENIYDALTEVSEKFIIEAQNTKFKKSSIKLTSWLAVAASVVLALGIGSFVYFQPIGGSSGGGTNSTDVPDGWSATGAGASGHDDGTVFMSYAGPVFPLTVLDGSEHITASRDVTFDFEKFGWSDRVENGIWLSHNDIKVKDSYTLTSAASQTSVIVYPFVGSYTELYKQRPIIYVDGKEAETKLLAGAYSGGFTNAGDNMNSTYNLKAIESWEGYQQLLSGGGYMARALEDLPELSQPVTVYEFSNAQADHSEADYPTVEISFNFDKRRTTMLIYNFDAMGSTGDGYTLDFFVRDMRTSYYLIIVGDDINGLDIHGKGTAVSATADVTRYESRLGDILYTMFGDYMQEYNERWAVDAGFLDSYMDSLYKTASEFLLDYGVLSENGADRYKYGSITQIFDETLTLDRVFYLSTDIEMSVGENVEVTAELIRSGSFDFYCSGSDNADIQGYDMVTTLGTTLSFDRVGARLENTNGIEIVRQNFGFDIPNEILEVELDTGIPHYYMEVRGRGRTLIPYGE